MSHPKKVGHLPVDGDDKFKRTNEIKIAIPLLEAIDIEGKLITADALLTLRAFADYLVHQRNANYHLTVKGNQQTLCKTSNFFLRIEPDFVEETSSNHGRIDIRKIWTTNELN